MKIQLENTQTPNHPPTPPEIPHLIQNFPTSIKQLKNQIKQSSNNLDSLMTNVIIPHRSNTFLFPLLKMNLDLFIQTIISCRQKKSISDQESLFLMFMVNRFYRHSSSLVPLMACLEAIDFKFLLTRLFEISLAKMLSLQGFSPLLEESVLMLLLVSENLDLEVFSGLVQNVTSAKNYKTLHRHFLKNLMINDSNQKKNFSTFLDLERLLNVKTNGSPYEVVFNASANTFELEEAKTPLKLPQLLLHQITTLLETHLSKTLSEFRTAFHTLISSQSPKTHPHLLQTPLFPQLNLISHLLQILLNLSANKKTHFFTDLSIKNALLIPKLSLFIQSIESITNSMTDVCFEHQNTNSSDSSDSSSLKVNMLRVEIGIFASFLDSLRSSLRTMRRVGLESERMRDPSQTLEAAQRRATLRNLDTLKKLQLILFRKFQHKADDLGVFSPLENFNQPLQLISLFRKLTVEDLGFLLSVFYQSFGQMMSQNPFFRKFESSEQSRKFLIREVLVHLLTLDLPDLLREGPPVDPGVDFFSVNSGVFAFDDLKTNFVYQMRLFYVQKIEHIDAIVRAEDSENYLLNLFGSMCPDANFSNFLTQVDYLYTCLHIDAFSMPPFANTSNHTHCLQNLYRSLISTELQIQMTRTKFATDTMLHALKKEIISLKETNSDFSKKFHSFLVSTLNESNKNSLEHFLSFNYSKQEKALESEDLVINSSELSDLGKLREILLEGDTSTILSSASLGKIPFHLKAKFLLWHRYKNQDLFLKPREFEYARKRVGLCNLKRMNIFKVQESKVGSDRPQEVLGECSFSNVYMEEAIKDSWDNLRCHERLFLVEAGFHTHTLPGLSLIKSEQSPIIFGKFVNLYGAGFRHYSLFLWFLCFFLFFVYVANQKSTV